MGRAGGHAGPAVGVLMERFTASDLITWITTYAAAIGENAAYLTELDSAIGDADHGTNMKRGLEAAVAALQEKDPATGKEVLTTVGMTLVSTVGGASGPLYGTLFLRLGTAVGDADSVDRELFGAAWHAALDGVAARGKAQPGDKTMLDALTPAIEAFDAATGGLAEALEAAARAAADGRDATAPMEARRGRASYLGERSVGHIDPGAASTALLLDAAARVAS